MPFGSVAVAVMNGFVVFPADKVTLIVALPLLSVVTLEEPRNVCPSPKPDGLHAALEKKSSVNEVPGVQFSVP